MVCIGDRHSSNDATILKSKQLYSQNKSNHHKPSRVTEYPSKVSIVVTYQQQNTFMELSAPCDVKLGCDSSSVDVVAEVEVVVVVKSRSWYVDRTEGVEVGYKYGRGVI